MRARRQLFLFGSLASVAGASLLQAQKTFEGTISYDVNMTGTPMQLTLSSRGRRVRQDMDIPGANVVSRGTYQVIEYDKHNVITVVPEMKRYMVADFTMTRGQPDAARDSAREKAFASLSATGRQETIAGVACQVYVLKDRPGDEWCITSALGHFLGLEGGSGAAPFGGGPSTTSLMRNFRGGAVLLRMRMAGADGRDITMTATRIDRTTPPASHFSIPAGFEEMQNPMVARP